MWHLKSEKYDLLPNQNVYKVEKYMITARGSQTLVNNMQHLEGGGGGVLGEFIFPLPDFFRVNFPLPDFFRVNFPLPNLLLVHFPLPKIFFSHFQNFCR